MCLSINHLCVYVSKTLPKHTILGFQCFISSVPCYLCGSLSLASYLMYESEVFMIQLRTPLRELFHIKCSHGNPKI